MSEENIEPEFQPSKMQQIKEAIQSLAQTTYRTMRYLPTKCLEGACRKQTPFWVKIALIFGADPNAKLVLNGRIDPPQPGCQDSQVTLCNPLILLAVAASMCDNLASKETKEIAQLLTPKTDTNSVLLQETRWKPQGSMTTNKNPPNSYSLEELYSNPDLLHPIDEIHINNVFAFLRQQKLQQRQ